MGKQAVCMCLCAGITPVRAVQILKKHERAVQTLKKLGKSLSLQ